MTTASVADLDTGITLGSTGQRTRWTLTPWGSIIPWGVDPVDQVAFDWHVAADDRWHVPSEEPTVRQSRIEGTPVVETRLRVPDGDAVQRVWAVPDGGGTVIVEFENESPMPFAVALTGPRVVTERPPADVPIQGIELDGDAVVLPIGHRAVVRLALPHPGGTMRPESLGQVPPSVAVVRGWTRIVEQASRLVLPDEQLVHAVVAARCDLLLEGPVDADDDPVGFLLDVAELVRCGDDADAWLPAIVAPSEHLARLAVKRSSTATEVSDAVQALAAALLVAQRAGDERAAGDIERTVDRVTTKRTDVDGTEGVIASFADARRTGSVGRFVRSVERRIVDAGRIMSGGIPTSWLGSNFEVHAIPTSPSTSASFAVRWHGERPAVLWEQQGATPVRLSAPDVDPQWETQERSGEALWPAPAPKRSATSSLSITIDADPEPGSSFV
ncbi:hypothetical protein [Ilumatobacter sp.]|uniref:hypothetical protein n=1 Tax=Ilumatobacter sp. TaxID=1967498 RepID=UPI003C347421